MVGSFDSVGHPELKRMLNQRVGDGVVRRLVSKWLHAGVWEMGQVSFPEKGTPQGGVVTLPTQSITLSLQWMSGMKGNFPSIAQSVGKIANERLNMTYVVVYMCHHEKVIKSRTGQESQPGNWDYSRRRDSYRREAGVGGEIRNLRQTGFPLSENCGDELRSACDTGEESGLYREIAGQPYSSSQASRTNFRLRHRRSCGGGSGNPPENERESWEEGKTDTDLSWNTTTTGWGPGNLSWPINCSSLPRLHHHAKRHCLLKT